jgi:hypothetical protein
VVNTLPLNRLQGSIPVSVAVATPGTYTLTAGGIDSFVPGTSISLTDKQSGSTQVLNNNSIYTFSASPSDAPDRFVLNFLNVTSVPEPDAEETFKVTQSSGSLIITTTVAMDAEIIITNIPGQTVSRSRMNGSSRATINISGLRTGVYVVSLLEGNKKTSKKIIVNN